MGSEKLQEYWPDNWGIDRTCKQLPVKVRNHYQYQTHVKIKYVVAFRCSES